MICRTIRGHLDAFLDGELDPGTQVEFEQHLFGCAECQEHLAFERSFRAQLKQSAVAHGAPAGLAQRVRGALDREDQVREGPLGIRFLPMRAGRTGAIAAAAVLMLAVASSVPAVSFDTFQSSALPALDEVVRLHSANLPADVEGLPAQQITSYFRDKVHFPVHPPEFERQEGRLLRARVSNVRDHSAAALYYDVQGRRVTVVVFEASDPIDEDSVEHTRMLGRDISYRLVRGYTVPVLQEGSIVYALTGDLDRPSLLRLAATARMHP